MHYSPTPRPLPSCPHGHTYTHTPPRHDLVHLCTGETNSRAAPSSFVLNKRFAGVFKRQSPHKNEWQPAKQQNKIQKRHDGQFYERITQIYNSLCNHRCFIPRAVQHNAESGAVWNTRSPAHKGDVNVIRAHWSGKSSTGSWRLDGEVSPGFWGGWGRGKGRSRWSQRLYGWWSKLKWGARGRQFGVQNIAGWPVHCWTVGHDEFQKVLQRPLFALAGSLLKTAAGSLATEKGTAIYFSSVFSPILAVASVESCPSTLQALHVLKNIFPITPADGACCNPRHLGLDPAAPGCLVDGRNPSGRVQGSHSWSTRHGHTARRLVSHLSRDLQQVSFVWLMLITVHRATSGLVPFDGGEQKCNQGLD